MRRFVGLSVLVLCLIGLSLSISAVAVDAGASGEPLSTSSDGHSLTLESFDTTHSTALGTTTTSTGALESETSKDTIDQQMTLYQRPDHPGEFDAEVTIHVPDTVSELTIELESDAEVRSLDGFEQTADGYEWTGETRSPDVTFRMPADREHLGQHQSGSVGVQADGDGDGFVDGDGGDDTNVNAHTDTNTNANAHAHQYSDGYSFTETGTWGIVAVPTLSFAWTQSDPVTVTRSVEVAGPGATGGDIAFFGEMDEISQETAHGETIRLVVPDVSDMRESPDDVLESLASTSESLLVGAPNDEVFVVAVPADEVDWVANGIQYGDSDAWVTDDSPLDEPNNVWIHEYVHTRQDFTTAPAGTTPETRWIVEGQAEYYAGLTSLEQGLIDFEEFRHFLAEGERSPYTDGVLADPSTWHHDQTDYMKGRLVVGELDRQIRLETAGERTAAPLFRALNREEDPVSATTFSALVEAEAGADVRELTEQYTQTTDTPTAWSARAHQDAFDQDTALLTYALADEDDLEPTVSGQTREGLLEELTPVVPGETITYHVVVENVGERAGSYDATLQADGTVVDSQTGSLEAGDRSVETLSWTPESVGSVDVQVGDRRLTVDVRSPATAEVTDLTLDPDRVAVDEDVTATATVVGDEIRPSEATVEFRTPAGVADEQTVTLAPGETTTVETTLTFDSSAEYEVAVGDHVRTVIVERSGIEGTVEDGVDAVPGFGGVAAGIAIAAVVGLCFARRLEWVVDRRS